MVARLASTAAITVCVEVVAFQQAATIWLVMVSISSASVGASSPMLTFSDRSSPAAQLLDDAGQLVQRVLGVLRLEALVVGQVGGWSAGVSRSMASRCRRPSRRRHRAAPGSLAAVGQAVAAGRRHRCSRCQGQARDATPLGVDRRATTSWLAVSASLGIAERGGERPGRSPRRACSPCISRGVAVGVVIARPRWGRSGIASPRALLDALLVALQVAGAQRLLQPPQHQCNPAPGACTKG
jgi:hypothetical protein